jgi:decaprenylphospho-beta-D-ribofuranose 2-oxidase
VGFDLLGADGTVRHCSRNENTNLFALAIGGYGLFGFITRVELQFSRSSAGTIRTRSFRAPGISTTGGF